MQFQHRFVDSIPKTLEPRILYIALYCGAVVHLCACGCGNEAVTPLGRTDWSILYDGESISLHPSVGNWSFPCRSHYLITNDEIVWAPQWSTEKIEEGRYRDRTLKGLESPSAGPDASIVEVARPHINLMSRLRGWLRL